MVPPPLNSHAASGRQAQTNSVSQPCDLVNRNFKYRNTFSDRLRDEGPRSRQLNAQEKAAHRGPFHLAVDLVVLLLKTAPMPGQSQSQQSPQCEKTEPEALTVAHYAPTVTLHCREWHASGG